MKLNTISRDQPKIRISKNKDNDVVSALLTMAMSY